MIIGVTGKSGVGKNYIIETTYKSNWEADHVDIDKIAHQVLDIPSVRKQLIKTFGKQIAGDNKINRRALAEIVFTSRDKYKTLSDIVWVHMQKKIDARIKGQDNIVLNWILLPLTHYWNMCDIKVLIERKEKKRIHDVCSRDCITPAQLSLRDKHSIKYNKRDFNFIIQNRG